MTAYFVDTENVHSNWSRELASAGPGDEFFLFHSPVSPRIGMDLFGDASLRGVNFRFIPCAVGPNAMDFQIATELGRRIGAGWDGSVAILSGDHGFDAVVDYWSRQGVSIERRDCGPAECPRSSPFAGLGLAREACMALDQFVGQARKKGGSLDKQVNHVHCKVGSAYPGKRGREIWGRANKAVRSALAAGMDADGSAPSGSGKKDKAGRDGAPDAAAVHKAYMDGMSGLTGVQLGEEELKACVNVLTYAMKQPENRRRAIVCSQFRSTLGDGRGRTAYIGIRPLLGEWSEKGVVPPV